MTTRFTIPITSERTRSGNSSVGTFTLNESSESTWTREGTGSNSSSLAPATGTAWSHSAALSGTGTVIETQWDTRAETGNEATGAYSLAETHGSTVTSWGDGDDRSLSQTGTAVQWNTTGTNESGNRYVGTYALTSNTSSGSTFDAAGTDARGTFTSEGGSTATSTRTETGNRAIGNRSWTETSAGSGYRLKSGGDGDREYSGGEDNNWDSTAVVVGSGLTGQVTSTTNGTNTATMWELGSSPTTDYTLDEWSESSVSGVSLEDVRTGEYSRTQTETVGVSLHAEGSEPSGGYTLDKVTDRANYWSRTGNGLIGAYHLEGEFGETSTAIETNFHGAYSASFTEILTEDRSLDESGSEFSGDYARHEQADTSANFVQLGTSAAGTVFVTESAHGTFDRNRLGNSATGGYSLSENADSTYSATETVNGSETWTLISRGTDSWQDHETGDDFTGLYSRGGTGTDNFTLIETGALTGGSVSQTVTGSDSYTTTEEGNHGKDIFTVATVGGGAWSRTGTNFGSGTNSYTHSASIDMRAGHFAQSVTGTLRYDLVERFEDASTSEDGVTTPGHVTMHSHGLLYRDDFWDDLKAKAQRRLDQAKQVVAVVNPLAASIVAPEYGRAAVEGYVQGGKDVLQGMKSAAVEQVQVARDLSNAALSMGLGPEVYQFDLHSELFSGYDKAVKNGKGDAFVFCLC